MSPPPYRIVNVKEVDDAAVRFGLAPNLESRFARGPLELEQSGISYFRIAPGFRQPFGHRHARQEEVYLVVTGSVRMKLDDDIVELHAWDAIRVPAQVMRCTEGGPNGAEMIAFGAPREESSEVELVRGWWVD